MKTKVAAYCRVSTDSQDQLNSFEAQKAYFEEYLSKRADFELVNIYADKGITGTSFQRLEFEQMIRDAGIDIIKVAQEGERRKNRVDYIYRISDREPLFRYVYIKNTSRFSRNVSAIEIVKKLRAKGVFIVFIDINHSTEDETKDFVLNLFMNFDENESMDKSRKVAWGHHQAAKNNSVHKSSKLYGYKYIKETRELEIIPEEAEIIKLIFDLYEQGLGVRRIANELTSRRFLTRQGKQFSPNSLKKFIKNDVYCGRNVRNKYDSSILKKQSPKIRPKEQWIVHENVFPAIISTELFDKCNEILEGKVNYQNQIGIYKGTSKYSSRMTCSKCGAVYTKNTDKGKSYYNCSNKKTNGVKACDNINIYESFIDDIIKSIAKEEYYEAITRDIACDIGILEELQSLIIDKVIDLDNNDRVKELVKLLEIEQDKSSKLTDIYLSNEISKDIYLQKNESIKNNISSLQLQIDELSKNNTEALEDIREIESVIQELEDMTPERSYTEEEIMSMITLIKVRRAYDDPNTPCLTIDFAIRDKIQQLTEKYQDKFYTLKYND